MADGNLQGPIQDIGQVAHTDSNATVVCSITLPSGVDGIYHVMARFGCITATGTNDCVGLLQRLVRVDGGSAVLMVGQTLDLANMQSTGYTVAFTTSGSDVRLSLTAASGIRSVGMIEAFGVEMALTIG